MKKRQLEIERFKNSKIFFGNGSLENIKYELEKLHVGKVFLITGRKSAAESGLLKRLKLLLDDYEIIWLNKISPHPTIVEIDDCINSFKKSQSDIIVGVGGGSVMDAAKVTSVFAKNKKRIADFIEWNPDFSEIKYPCITIPTLMGTGAEITPFAVVYHKDKKYSFDNPIIQADTAIIDPVLSVGAPLKLSFGTAFDALAQAIESYWSVRSTIESDEYAKEAIKILPNAIDRLVLTPESIEVHQELALASLFAGKAIAITRTTAPHALSYPFTIFFKVAHGAAVGLLLSHLFSYNYELTERNCKDKRGVKFVKGRLEQLAELLVGEKNIKKAVLFLEELRSRGPNIFLQEINLKDIEKLISAVNIQRLNNNPRSLTREEIEGIYHKIITAPIQY